MQMDASYIAFLVKKAKKVQQLNWLPWLVTYEIDIQNIESIYFHFTGIQYTRHLKHTLQWFNQNYESSLLVHITQITDADKIDKIEHLMYDKYKK